MAGERFCVAREVMTMGVGVYMEDCGGPACVDRDADKEPV